MFTFLGSLFKESKSNSNSKESQSNNQQPTNVYTTQEDPELYKNDKYHFLLPPIGAGGFSNVLAVKPKRRKWRSASLSVPSLRKKSFAEKLDAYPYAAKVCELNAEKFQVSEREYLLSLAGGVDLYDHMMQLADIKELQQEVQMLQDLRDSEYVVNVHDAFEYTPNQQYWMIMERMSTTLTDLTCKGTWGKHPAARVCVLREVLEALIFLKSKRIVHGDIKPSNILVDKGGAVKLCDFGIAQKIPEGDTKLIVKEQRGSLPYMAPELFIDGCEYDYAVDVWSFGWVIYSTYTNNSRSAFENRVPASNMRFNDKEWERWRISDARYFENLLGPGYVTQAERDCIRKEVDRREMETRPAWMTLPSDKSLQEKKKRRRERDAEGNKFYSANNQRVLLLRSVLIPMSPGSQVGTNSSTFIRATAEQVQQMQYFSRSVDSGNNSDHRQICEIFK